MKIKNIQEQVLKKVKRLWSNESQIGFSELAMRDAISMTEELMKVKFQEELKNER